MAEVPAAATAPPAIVVVNGLADLLPDSYSGDHMSVDIEEFFGRFRQWLNQNIYALTLRK